MSAQSLKSMTKAELIEIIAQCNDSNQILRDHIHELETRLGTLTATRTQQSAARTAYLERCAANRQRDEARRAEWTAKCAAARELALKTGKPVVIQL